MSDILEGIIGDGGPDLLVGPHTSDDAGVYRISPDTALVTTADFITPPVDDPYRFGAIAAANSLSDIYAMGGRPLTALNLVMFPARKLDVSVLREILRGGADKVAESGACIAGGHTVEDAEPKYGLAVTGVVHPDRILTNCGARAGDALILTKPIGTGALFNAVVMRKATIEEAYPATVLDEIAALNAAAATVALEQGATSCTDITGFGLLGHMCEMMLPGGVRARLSFSRIPLYPNAVEFYRRGVRTGSNQPNLMMVQKHITFSPNLTPHQREVLVGPQTSGGLLFSLPADRAAAAVAALHERGVTHASIIGEVIEGTPGIDVTD